MASHLCRYCKYSCDCGGDDMEDCIACTFCAAYEEPEDDDNPPTWRDDE